MATCRRYRRCGVKGEITPVYQMVTCPMTSRGGGLAEWFAFSECFSSFYIFSSAMPYARVYLLFRPHKATKEGCQTSCCANVLCSQFAKCNSKLMLMNYTKLKFSSLTVTVTVTAKPLPVLITPISE